VSQAELAPSCSGLGSGRAADSCVVVICGAAGDLTRRELIPSLFELFQDKLLPEACAIIGFSRADWDDDTFRKQMRAAHEEFAGPVDAAQWDRFAACLGFVPGDFTAPADGPYAALAQRIATEQQRRSIPDNVLFHLATPPVVYEEIVGKLAACGLAQSNGGWRRVVIEKPFGADAASAAHLDQVVRAVFPEKCVYRIDHFLGKETVQNMLVVRFANPSFEPIWNRQFIDHVQITVAEDIGIGTRAGFYEQTGVVRDMVQNHLLQLVCMTAIEPPNRFDGASLRDETVKVLEAIAPPGDTSVVGGQYGPGVVNGAKVVGYREEAGVTPGSRTRTFAAVKLEIDNWRWAGVPFYLRTGKRLARRLTEVVIQFKPTPHLMFPVDRGQMHSNVLLFRLQPDEGIVQTFAAKQPGPEVTVTPVTMSFSYANAFGIARAPRAYGWLLHDAMKGDQTLFARADWIDRAWRIVDPVVERWNAAGGADPFPNYTPGSWGPAAADDMLRRDGREWRAI
jgi:glucose-6-phosphate 1-dehydrogenase